MRAGQITLVVLVLAGTLSGCGQKGPLYHDAPEQVSAGTGDEGSENRPEDQDDDR